MRVLLDTHAFLWFIEGDARLGTHARHLIESPNNDRLLSVATLWEMSIKVGLGKLRIGLPFPRLVADHVHGNAMGLLQVRPEHLDAVVVLPFYHRDPFDRLLIAQCECEGAAIPSRDEAFDSYGLERYWEL